MEKEGSLEKADKRLNIRRMLDSLRDLIMWLVKRNLGWRVQPIHTMEDGSCTCAFPFWTLRPPSPGPQLPSQLG